METITILAVREENQLLVLNKNKYKNIDLINFPIVKEREAYYRNSLALLHAIAASPSKYVEHAFQKVKTKINSSYFLLNPIIEIQNENWSFLLNRLLEMNQSDYVVLSTANDVPLGLFIPNDRKQEIMNHFMLRFLSFTSATLDFALLKKYFNQTQIIFLCFNELFSSDNGFYTDPQNLTLYKLTASHYLQATSMHLDKKIIEYIAVMPYHAGDALFLSYALQESRHPFNAIMINACYADIVRKVLPDLKIYLITDDPINRGKNKNNNKTNHQNIEHLYFLDIIYPNVPKASMFQYLRPFRNCDEAKIHFIDQWKSSISSEDCPLLTKSAPAEAIQMALNKINKQIDKSILCHFDAGWHLKIYPYDDQKKLVQLLKKAGFRITVLAEVQLTLPVDQTVPFTGLQDLEKAVLSHALFLGMDSFPSHFSTQVLKHPSITLFSSTEPENASAPDSIIHKNLYNFLTCCPCRATTHCPVYGLDFCKNFPAVQVVFETIETMYETVYS